MSAHATHQSETLALAADFVPAPWWQRCWEALLIFLLTWLGYVGVAASLPLAWDEGYTFDRVAGLQLWWQMGQPLDQASLDKYWRFSREEPDGHSPFYGLLSWGSQALTSSWLRPPLSYRLGTVTLTALASAVCYITLVTFWPRPLAGLTVWMIFTCPRLLPEWGFALIDGPLVALYLLSWCAFVHAVRCRSYLLYAVFGFLIGCAMATKLTGWFYWLPAAGWTCTTLLFTSNTYHSGRQRFLLGGLVLALGVAGLTVLFWNVGWWPNFSENLQRYFQSNLGRKETIAIPTTFLGRRYEFSLPWYNVPIWLAVTVPVTTLVAGSIGIVVICRQSGNSLHWLLLYQFLLLVMLRSAPNVPGHDGTRQINSAIAFLALLAGVGLYWCWRYLEGKRRWQLLLLLLPVGENTWALYRYHPHELSYYNFLAGGLPGATQYMGMETTYFWDSLTPDVLAWLNDQTPSSHWVLFCNYSRSFHYLEKWGQIHFTATPQPHQAPYFYVLQHREGMIDPYEAWLLEHATPVYRRSLLGVPLLSIYSGADFQQAQQETSPP